MYCLTLWHMYTHETATTISVVNMFITFRRNFLLPVCDRFLPYLPTACPQGPLMSFPSLWVSSACIIGFSDSFLFFFFLLVCAGSSLLHELFSSCGEPGLLSSCCGQTSVLGPLKEGLTVPKLVRCVFLASPALLLHGAHCKDPAPSLLPSFTGLNQTKRTSSHQYHVAP